MRKIIAVIVILVVLGGGYAAYWHKVADDNKAAVAQNISDINAAAKAYLKDKDLLHYDSITATGFPFGMVIEINKPTLNIPMSGIQEYARTHSPSPTAPKGPIPFEWIEQITWNDKITITSNISGDSFTATTNGDRNEKTLVDNTARHTQIASSASPLTCHLNVEKTKSGTPWMMQPIFTDAATFLSVFHGFDCNIEGLTVKDAVSGALLVSTDAVAFSATNQKSDGANRKIAVTLDSRNVKGTPALDETMKDYSLMSYTLIGKADAIPAFTPISEFGEFNSKFDIVYNGPTDIKIFADPSYQLHFDINTFEIHNALYNLAMDLHLADGVQGTNRDFSLTGHYAMDTTARSDELTKKSLIYSVNEYAKTMDTVAGNDSFSKKVAAIGPEAIIAKVYPDLHSLGKTSMVIDLNIKGPNEGNAYLKRGVATLNGFDVLADPYGLKLKGASDMSAMGKPPTGDLNITCISCDALVGDLGSYLMRVESIVDQLGKEPQRAYLNKDIVDSTKLFLRGIAQDGNAKDLVIQIVMKDGSFTISGKQLPEVMALYMSTIAPRLAQPQAEPTTGGVQPEPAPAR